MSFRNEKVGGRTANASGVCRTKMTIARQASRIGVLWRTTVSIPHDGKVGNPQYKRPTMTDSFSALKADVQTFLRESEADRPTSNPMLQIGTIITAMRVFKAAVVSAHAPRGFQTGAERDPKQRQVIQDHRRADLDELKRQKEWLLGLDFDFVLQGQPWRINEAVWESEIFGPICRWVRQGVEFLFDGQDRVDFQWLRSWDSDELEIERQLIAQTIEFLPEGKWPIADLDAGILRWDSRDKEMPMPVLKTLSCVFKARGQYAELFDSDGNELEPEAMRQVDSRTKRCLLKHDFPDIADCLERDPKYTGIRLNHPKLMAHFRERHTPK